MGRGRKLRDRLEKAERNSLASDANELEKRYINAAGRLTWSCDDRKDLERMAQALHTFSSVFRAKGA